MPDKEIAAQQPKDSQKTNGNPFSAACARFKLLPITWRVIGGALFGVIILGAVAYFLPNMKERMKFFTDATLSWLILVIVAVQAYIYSKQWGVMERQLEIADRPWLAVDVIPIKPLTFDDQGCSLSFKITAKNVGRSVAVNATINAKVIIPSFDKPQVDLLDQVIGEQARFCQSVGSQFMSYAIFPERDYFLNHSFGVQQQELEQGRLPSTPKTDIVMIFLIGCVDYQFSGHSPHHQTRFAYEVYSSSTQHPDPVLISIGHDVPLERLRLRKSIVGGDHAS